MQPCQNEKTIQMLHEHILRMDAKLDTLLEYKAQQTGAVRILYVITMAVGGFVGWLADKLIK